jgi:hypothetical protein
MSDAAPERRVTGEVDPITAGAGMARAVIGAVVVFVGAVVAVVAYGQSMQTKAETKATLENYETKEQHKADMILPNNRITQLEEADKLYLESNAEFKKDIDKTLRKLLIEITRTRTIVEQRHR